MQHGWGDSGAQMPASRLHKAGLWRPCYCRAPCLHVKALRAVAGSPEHGIQHSGGGTGGGIGGVGGGDGVGGNEPGQPRRLQYALATLLVRLHWPNASVGAL